MRIVGVIVSDADKIRLEAATFESLLHLGKIAFDRHEPGCPPEPDIIAWRGGLEFGIEITYFHRPLEKERHSNEDRTVEKAQQIYSSFGGPGIELTLMWAPHFVVRKKDHEGLAKRIAHFVLNHAPTVGQSFSFEWQHFDSELMQAIAYISAYGMPVGSPSHWHAGRGRSVPAWDFDQLQQTIDRKKNKPRAYIRRYEKIWLLIASGFGAPSSWMEANDEIRRGTFVSPFDKVFLLSSFPLEVIELHSVYPAVP